MNDPGKAVFLSYASQDAEAAQRICEALRAAGVEVWFDRNELVGGDAWDQKIRKQIKECALLIPIISANTQARTEGYFRLEWRLADQRTHLMAKGRPFLLPVVTDDTKDTEAHVPDSFLDVQWTKAPGGEVSPAFVARVQKLLEGDVGRGRRTPPSTSAAGFGDPALKSAKRAELGEGGPAPVRNRARGLWFVAAVAGAVGLGVLLTVRPWRNPAEKPEGAAPASASPVAANASAPTLSRVGAILAKTDVTRAELELAGQLLAQAAQNDPANALVFAARARVEFRYLEEYYDWSEARKDSARQQVAQAVALAPDLREVRLVRAQGLRLLGGDAARAEALAVYRQLAAEQPTNAEVLFGLVECLRAVGAQSEALEKLRAAEALPGAAGRALFERAIITIFFSGDYAGGLALLQQATEREPAVQFLLWRSFIETIWLGDTAQARRTLSRVPPDYFLEDMPASAKYFVEIRARDFEAALATIRAVPRDYVQSGAGAYSTGYLRGRALHFLGRTAAAESEWRSALDKVEKRLATTGNDGDLLMGKATLLAALGEHEAAGKVWTTVTELYGRFSHNWTTLYFAAAQYSADEMIALLAEGPKTFAWRTAAELRLDPYFDRFRDDPRFTALLREAEADPKRSPKAMAKTADRVPAPLTEARKLAEQAWQLAMANSAEGQGMRSAMDMGERAVELDRLDGEVWALAARVDLHAFVLGFDMGEVRQERIRTKVTRARSLAPESVIGRISEAQMLTKLDRTPAALAEADRILHDLLAEDIPANERESVLGMRAAVLEAQDQFEAAARAYEQAGPGWLVSSAWAYLNAGKIPEALVIAEKLRAHRPDQGWEMAAIAHQMAGDLAAARHALDQVSVTGQKAEVHLSLRVWNALLLRDWEGALSASRQLPGEFVENLFFSGPRRTAAGWAHHYAGRPEAARVEWLAALRVVEKRLETDPTAERNLWSLWVLQRVLGRTIEADQTERLMLQIGNLKVGQSAVFFPAIKRDAEATLLAAAEQLRPENRKNWNLSVHTALRYDPEFDFLRADPRFQKLLRDTLLPGAKPIDREQPEAKP